MAWDRRPGEFFYPIYANVVPEHWDADPAAVPFSMGKSTVFRFGSIILLQSTWLSVWGETNRQPSPFADDD